MKREQAKKAKNTSIFLRIFVPLLLLVILQAAMLFAVLTVRGVFTNLNENSLRLLEESTKNKQQVLLSNMINDWSDLKISEETINDIVEQELTSHGKDWEGIKTDASLNKDIVIHSTDELIKRLRTCKTTGIFMVLNGIAVDNDPDSYAGFYVRDADPYSNTNDQSDLLMLRGLPIVSRHENLSLHSFWNSCFKFEGGAENPDNRFFFNPLLAAMESTSQESQYFGYWCPTFVFGDKSDQEVITYSMPLINRDGLVYGVLGVEINQAFLTQRISNDRFGDRADCFYYLGIEENDSLSFEKVTSSGDRFGMQEFSAERDSITKDHRFIETENRQGDTIFGTMEKLKLYNSNTPFESEQWVLLGMQDKNSLFSASEQAKKTISLSLLISIVLGCLLSILVGRSIVHPIMNLVNGVRSDNENKLTSLPHSGVREIDELADAIDIRNQEILESARRTSTFIELSGLPAGGYEIREEIGKVYCSKGFLSLLACDEECLDEEHVTLQELKLILKRAMEKPIGYDMYELEKDGRKRYIRLVSQKSENGIIGAVLDTTKEINDRRRIERERDFDSLTGIWNRRAFENKMDYLFGEHRELLGFGALVMLDLDNLKFINDVYGHDCGDEYICTFAGELKKCLTEHTLLARRSGDEFYMFVYGFKSKEEAIEEVKRIWEHIGSCSIELPDKSMFRVRFSGGVSWYPENATMPSKLIHYADFAMYQVKHSQKGSIQEFDIEEYNANSFLFNGHDALNRLIDQQLVRFMFQPIFSAKTGEVYGYELLMRSNVEELKTPDVILRMAKSQGKLYHIERITWNRTMETIREVQEEKLLPDNTFLFINSIANQTLFREEEESIVAGYQDLLPRVVLEVTEGEDNNMDYTNRKLLFIRKYGGHVAIDDFGTGYNSELALVMITADIVKIDISLVRDVDSDKDKQILIRNLISYAKQRDIAVLAEGVETRAEMKVLVDFGVDYLQGYYLGRPDYDIATEMPKEIKEDLLMVQR